MRVFRRGVPAVLVILLSVLFLKGSSLNVPTGTWQSTATMSVARANAVAVLVPDGRIVIAGGTDATGAPTASAEAFSADGTFSALPAMSVARARHAAIYTMTGDLLVTGGVTSGGGFDNTAEVFDSLTNTWHSLSAAMVESRAGHTMSQLQNGNVLIAGGENSSGPVAALEIYDITSGQFSFAGTLATARKGHAAAVLNDGRVLIIGGTTVQSDGTSATLASTEIYDPSTGQVTAGPSLATPRADATATTLLDGRVLVVGGSYPEGANGAAPELASAEIYDPASSTFTASASHLTTARTGHVAFLLPNNNNVLIVGGTNSQPDATSTLVSTPLASAELYTPWADTFATTAPMSAARTAATGSALGNGTYIGLDGMLLIAGGTNQNSAEVYGFATVKTDHPDYAPGETVTITGQGWKPGETVTLTLKESPAIDTPGPFTVTADASGSIANSEFVTDAQDYSVHFTLTALGSVSGVQAQNTFKDANPTNTTLASSLNPANVGDSVTFTATVRNGSTQGSGTPVTVGNITFGTGGNSNCGGAFVAFSGGSNLSLNASGQAAITTTFASGGTPTVRACYSGTGGNTGTQNSADSLTQTINAAVGTTTNLASSVNPSVFGQNVAFTATVTSTSGTPTGSVQFKIDGTNSGSPVALVSGVATSGSITSLSVAGSPHAIEADYIPTGNFTASTSTLQQTVNKATPTITWSIPADINYGAALSATQLNATASVPGAFVYTPAAGTVLGAGPNQTLSVTFTPTDSANYNTTTTTVSINVIKASLTVTADNKSRGYGEPNPALTYTITGFVNGDTQSVLSGTPALTTPANATSSVAGSPYPITVALGSLTATNYTFHLVDGQLTVTPAAATITANDASRNYGDANPAFGFTPTGLKNSETSAVFTTQPTCTTTATTASPVTPPTYPITCSGAVAANYTFSYVDGALTINKRPVTVTADPQSKLYGDADPPLTYKVTSGSVVNGDAFSGVPTRVSGENVATSPYAIQQGTLTLGDNYLITFEGANLTITPRPITVTADSKYKIYGDSDPAFTYQITTGSLAFSDTLTGTLARAVGESVGTYPITQGTLTGGSNYNLTFVPGDLTITPRPITVTADTRTKVYGDSDPTLTYQITSGSLAFSDSFSGALTRAAGESVGNYAISQGTLTLNSNYNLTFVGANFSITPRPITVTADAKSKVYGESDPALTYLITSGSLAFNDVFSGTLTRVSGEDVGNYAIQRGTLALNSNYNLTFIGANFSITPRPITVTADLQTKVYGNPDPALTYQITSGSLVSGDSFTGTLARAAGENVGNYAITQGTLTLNSNYNLTFVGANISITARPITVTADAKTKTYGDPDPALTYQITSGSLVSGDNFSGALVRVSGENIGLYAIQQGTLLLSSNYALTYVGANLTITKRSVTVTADAKTKVYGAVDPALTYSITNGSLASGDSFAGSLTRIAGENVGAYAIQQGTLALNSNYDLTYGGADLTITARPVTVTADAKTKVYGAADPALTYQISSGSLVSGDVFSGALIRVSGENVGSYAIQQGTLALSTNYTLTYVGANLTITARPITVTADAKTKILSAPDPALTYQITSGSLVNGDTFSGALTRTAGEAIGTYPILQGTLDLSSNYNLTYVGASLKIVYASTGSCLGSPGHSILQPINSDGTSVFKQGSTTPAKFRVCDANGNSIGTFGVVVTFRVIQTISGTVVTQVDESVDSTTPDTAFRWDPTGQQWIYNINTKALPKNQTYVFQITLNDGTPITFQYGLR